MVLWAAVAAAALAFIYCAEIVFDNPLDERGDNYFLDGVQDGPLKNQMSATNENGVPGFLTDPTLRDCNFRVPVVAVIGPNPAIIGRPNLEQGSAELQSLMGGAGGFELDALLMVDGRLESHPENDDAVVTNINLYNMHSPPDGYTFEPYHLGVVLSVGTYFVEYMVERQCGGRAVASVAARRTVIIQTEATNIEGQDRPISVALAGLDVVEVAVGGTYSDEGATATDGNGLPITRFVSVDIFLDGATTPITSSLTGGYPDGIPVNEIPLFVNTVFAGLTQEPASFRIVYEAASQIFGNPHTGSVTRTVNVTVHDPGTLPTIRIILGQYTHNIDGLVINSPDTAVAFGNVAPDQTVYTSKGVQRAYYICGPANTNGCTVGAEVDVPVDLVTTPPTTLTPPMFRSHPRIYSIPDDPNLQYRANSAQRLIHVYERLTANATCWPDSEPSGPPIIDITGANPLILPAGVPWSGAANLWNGVRIQIGDCYTAVGEAPYRYLIHFGTLNPADPQPGQYTITYVALGMGTGYTATVARNVSVQ
jgi:hypothetical protein